MDRYDHIIDRQPSDLDEDEYWEALNGLTTWTHHAADLYALAAEAVRGPRSK